MGKKINRDGVTIKSLLNQRIKQAEIAEMLGVSKQKVHYWKKTEIKTEQKRKKKLDKKYIDKIFELAKDKPTSEMGSKRIASIINAELEKDAKEGKAHPKKIHFSTVCRYLKEFYGSPRKIRKSFYLSEEQKKKRLAFCKMIVNKNFDSKQVFFTDECKIDMGSFVKDTIRLSPTTKEQLKKGDLEAYNLINRPEKKFEKSIMIAGGICYYGLSRLQIIDGTLNEFGYGQGLLYYEEDIKRISQNSGKVIIFEQDGAKAHTSKANILLLNRLFPEGKWIQNPPNSPDLAYPIEDLWAILKPRIKRRQPSSLEELKKFALEEWNSVPDTIIQNLTKGYLERIKKVIELNGERLEPEFTRKKRGQIKHVWSSPRTGKFCTIYNDEKLKILQQKEIAKLKKEKKEIPKEYRKKIKNSKNFKKRDLKYLSMGRALNIINAPKRLEEEKDKKLSDLEEEINNISNMSLTDYIRHLNLKENEKMKIEEEINDEESTLDEAIEKILKLKFISAEDKKIKYDLKF